TLVLDPVRTRGFVTFLQAKDEITFILEGPALLASLTWNRAGPNPTEPNGAGPGFGTNSQAVRYLDQDYEVLKRRLFQDDSFPALGSLGFNELGPRQAGSDEVLINPEGLTEPVLQQNLIQSYSGFAWFLQNLLGSSVG
ncbi:hypothetical protein CCH79_00020509, partial [Gambusia affinis]